MKQSEEAEGMRQLLIDAVSTLCRSGIRYRAAMRVEGLIGITVDEEDIILVNVNKTFEATDKDHSAADVVSPETVVSPESPGTPKSRTRKRPHQETQSPSQPEAKEYNDDEQTTNFVLKQEPDDETQPVEEKRLRHPSGDAPTDSVQATDSLDVASTIHVEAVKQCPVDNNETVFKGTTDSLQDSNLSFASSEASPSMYTQELSETGPRLSQDFEGNVRGVKIELGSESEGEGTQPLGPGQSDVMLAGNSGTFSFPSNMQLSPVPVNMFGPGENLTGETEAQLNFPGVMPSPSGASTSRKNEDSDSDSPADDLALSDSQFEAQFALDFGISLIDAPTPEDEDDQGSNDDQFDYPALSFPLDDLLNDQLDNTSDDKSGNSNYTCSVEGCEYKTERKWNLERHLARHTSLRKYICKTCNASFKEKYNLKNHIAVQHQNTVFTCEKCSSSFKSRSGLFEHYKRVHLKQFRYTCSECQKGFLAKEHYMDHCAKHMNIKIHQCDKCQKKFGSKKGYKTHIEMCGLKNLNP